jgi:hypothetical protein
VHLIGQVPLVIGGAEQGAQAMLQAIEPRHWGSLSHDM